MRAWLGIGIKYILMPCLLDSLFSLPLKLNSKLHYIRAQRKPCLLWTPWVQYFSGFLGEFYEIKPTHPKLNNFFYFRVKFVSYIYVLEGRRNNIDHCTNGTRRELSATCDLYWCTSGYAGGTRASAPSDRAATKQSRLT